MLLKKNIILKALILFSLFMGLNVQCSYADQFLLKPTGDYSVGFDDIRLVKGALSDGEYRCTSHSDPYYIKGQNEKNYGKDNQKDFCTEMMVRVYYPIIKKHGIPSSNYYLPAIEDIKQMILHAKVIGLVSKSLNMFFSVKECNTENKKVAAGKFPVLLFAPGNGMEVQRYSNILNELASHGYVIFGINVTGIGARIAFPYGRIVLHQDVSSPAMIKKLRAKPQSMEDLLTVRKFIANKDSRLKKFLSHLDLTHIGIFGHSAGAQSGVLPAVRKHPSLFNAAVTLDGPPMGHNTAEAPLPNSSAMKAFPIPFLRIFGSEWKCMYSPKIMKKQFQLGHDNYVVTMSPEPVLPSSCGDPKFKYYTSHMNFSDNSTLQYLPVFKLYLQQMDLIGRPWNVGTSKGVHISKLINSYILQFFNKYLKSKPESTYGHCLSLSKDSRISC